MPFVGIISKIKDYEFIKNKIVKDSMNNKIELININKNNVENIKNVKFEAIFVCDDLQDMQTQKTYIDNILNCSKYLVINTDNNVVNINIENNNMEIITYGMNQKATVTASSIKEDEILICLQRNIENINGKVIEMQEFKKKGEKIRNEEIYIILAAFILEQIYN